MGHVPLRYLQPADIALPAEMQILAPVERTMDRRAEAAMSAFVDALAASPRVGVTDPAVAQAALGRHGGQVGVALTAESLAAICKDARATGVVALEAFDASEAWDLKWTDEARTETVEHRVPGSDQVKTEQVTRTVRVWDARVKVGVETNWRVYDCAGKVVDSLGFTSYEEASACGDTEGDARSAIGPTDRMREAAAEEAGVGYARHIAPFEVDARRPYYMRGDSTLKQASKALLREDWGRARAQWEKAAASERDKVRGRALFNLALAAEQAGDLDAALDAVKKADKLLDNKKTEAYLDLLKKRKKAMRRLDRQMSPPPETPAAGEPSEPEPAR
jgi:tetratricopeptide (TPR) repeat protein